MVVIKHASRRKVNSTRMAAGERVISALKASAAAREYSSRGPLGAGPISSIISLLPRHRGRPRRLAV